MNLHGKHLDLKRALTHPEFRNLAPTLQRQTMTCACSHGEELIGPRWEMPFSSGRKAKFEAAGAPGARFGSGWVWLVVTKDKTRPEFRLSFLPSAMQKHGFFHKKVHPGSCRATHKKSKNDPM